MVDKSPGWLDENKLFQRKTDNFVDHIRYNDLTLAPGRDGLAVQNMLDAMYRSAAQKGI